MGTRTLTLTLSLSLSLSLTPHGEVDAGVAKVGTRTLTLTLSLSLTPHGEVDMGVAEAPRKPITSPHLHPHPHPRPHPRRRARPHQVLWKLITKNAPSGSLTFGNMKLRDGTYVFTLQQDYGRQCRATSERFDVKGNPNPDPNLGALRPQPEP